MWFSYSIHCRFNLINHPNLIDLYDDVVMVVMVVSDLHRPKCSVTIGAVAISAIASIKVIVAISATFLSLFLFMLMILFYSYSC